MEYFRKLLLAIKEVELIEVPRVGSIPEEKGHLFSRMEELVFSYLSKISGLIDEIDTYMQGVVDTLDKLHVTAIKRIDSINRLLESSINASKAGIIINEDFYVLTPTMVKGLEYSVEARGYILI